MRRAGNSHRKREFSDKKRAEGRGDGSVGRQMRCNLHTTRGCYSRLWDEFCAVETAELSPRLIIPYLLSSHNSSSLCCCCGIGLLVGLRYYTTDYSTVPDEEPCPPGYFRNTSHLYNIGEKKK